MIWGYHHFKKPRYPILVNIHLYPPLPSANLCADSSHASRNATPALQYILWPFPKHQLHSNRLRPVELPRYKAMGLDIFHS